ncbi:hypothetical protein ABID26_006341 [Mesorhizobium shonense]|uniref:Uncharacterized protein n=1 Tax=Mesorhizobium shonense TaxID=1209948 RepID=A0ABV2I3M5_9HYPH
MDRPGDTPLPIRRSRLRRPYIPTWRSPFAGASLRSGGGHSDAQLNRQHSAHVGSAAPGEDRLQKSCRVCGAQTGGYNAYDALKTGELFNPNPGAPA